MSLFDDDLSPDLRVLFDAERRRDEGVPHGAQDRVRAALAASIGVGIVGTATGAGAAKAAAATAGAAGAGKAAAAGGAVVGGGAAVGGAAAAGGAAAGGAAAAGGVTAAGGALAKGLAFALVAAMAGTAGTGVYLAQRDDKPADTAAAVVVEKSPASDAAWDPSILGKKPEEPKPLAEKPRPKVTAPVVEPPIVERVAMPVAPPVETPQEKAERLAGERTVLDEARAAVGRGDGSAALIALEAHRDHYPNGALVEEREALTVLALSKLNRMDEARAKAAKFRARFPSSLMLVAVDAAAPQ